MTKLSWAFCAVVISIVSVSGDYATYLGKVYSVPTSLPPPTAFFPLTEGFGQQVTAWPQSSLVGSFSATSNQTSWWATDETFGSTLRCNKSVNASVVLPSLDFANSGHFSIDLWFKPDVATLTGSDFQYLFSQSAYGLNNTQPAYAPDSINIYLPANQHPAFSLIRTIVKDMNDQNMTTFLDSDGQYSDNYARNFGAAKNVTDGNWHSVTVTSRPDNSSGYMVYVDGNLAAQLPTNRSISDAMLDGGGPFNLSGNAVLCSRDSLALENRFYSGLLSHLSVFNTALTSDQVSLLYQSVANGSLVTALPAASPSSSAAGSSPWLNQFANASNLQVVSGTVQLCNTSAGASSSCSTGYTGYTCAALTGRQLGLMGSSYQGSNVGVCSTSASQRPLSSSLPTPIVFFPMQNYSTGSWPIPDMQLRNATSNASVSWASDAIFGSAINCPDNAALRFDPPEWGQNGSFAVNMWIKQYSDPGNLFQYLVSARDSSNGPINNLSDVYKPNDLHIYLPETDHPATGTVRAIVKDNTDAYSSGRDEDFLDSDGFIGSNAYRNTPRLNLTDGDWHMITVTTLPSGSKGFEIFVDGMYMASLANPQQYFSVSGGYGISIDGPITLCGRSDLASARFFNGSIAQFSMYDSALTNSTISQLYGQVYSSVPATTQQASSIGRQSLSLRQNAAQGGSAASPASVPAVAAPVVLIVPIGDDDDDDLVIATQQTPSSSGGDLNLVTQAQNLPVSQWQSISGADGYGGSSEGPHGLSSGAIAGIVIGSVVGALLIASVIVFAALKVRRGRRMRGVHRLQEVALGDVMPDASVKLSNGVTLEDKYLADLVAKNSSEPQKEQELKISSKVHADAPDLL